jgi:hypothetical protein
MDESLLKTWIEEAEMRLSTAEQALATAIGELDTVPRAQKTITTRLIENALDEVKVTRAKVSELKRQTMGGEEEPPR